MSTNSRRTRRIGGWLPADQTELKNWVRTLVERVKANPTPLSPVVQDFKTLVQNDPELYMLFNEMLTQVPSKYIDDPSGVPEVRDIDTLFQVFNQLIQEAPTYNTSPQVGTPINAVLDWPMGTTAGFAAFLKDNVNAQFKKMLQAWGQFLTTPASCATLTTNPLSGWFNKAKLHSGVLADFAVVFECNPLEPHYGYTSWDAYFTRRFWPMIRPVAYPDDDSYIVNACEAAAFNWQENVNLLDTFWIKAQPYSLAHMMNNDPNAKLFVGGTVYQGFLSATSYHRWHAPVSGKIVSA
ncbi:Phophatidylserine decarboxylase-domain-containing protein, partial [Endogone sp. FLAS-F59071]